MGSETIGLSLPSGHPAVIRCMGRWSSDIFDIYMRMSREVATRFSVTVASTAFHDTERAYSTEALDDFVDVPELDWDDEDEM